MKKINLNAVPVQESRSPKGRFRQFSQDVLTAMRQTWLPMRAFMIWSALSASCHKKTHDAYAFRFFPRKPGAWPSMFLPLPASIFASSLSSPR